MFESNAFKPTDMHLINYGLILDQEVIYSSSQEFEQMLEIVNFTNSFAMNIHGGRLYKIKHEFNGEMYTTLADNRTVDSGGLLIYVISGSDQKLPQNFQKQILDNFCKEIDASVNIKKIKKLFEQKFDEFTIKVNRAVDKIDQGVDLIHDMEAHDQSFLVKDIPDQETRIHYIGVSTAGIPVRNRIYGSKLTQIFKLPAKEGTSSDEVLRSLISAQFSAIINSSYVKIGTRITEITINYTEFENLETHQLMVAFFPIGFKDQYTLEILYQGNRKDIEGFRSACNTMFEKFLQIKFKGNLKDFEFIADALSKLPERFGLFEHVHEERAKELEEINYPGKFDIMGDIGEREKIRDSFISGVEQEIGKIKNPTDFENEEGPEEKNHMREDPVQDNHVTSKAVGLFKIQSEKESVERSNMAKMEQSDHDLDEVLDFSEIEAQVPEGPPIKLLPDHIETENDDSRAVEDEKFEKIDDEKEKKNKKKDDGTSGDLTLNF